MRRYTMAATLTLTLVALSSFAWAGKPTARQQAIAELKEVADMADKVWVSTDGNLGTAASYSSSGVPAAQDSLTFDGSSQLDASSGMSTFSTSELNRVWIQRAYEGDVGADGNLFQLPAKLFIHNGPGSVYHHAKAIDVYPHHYIVIDSPNMQDAYTLGDTDTAGGVDQTWMVLNGAVKVLDSSAIVLGNFYIGPGRIAAPRVDIGLIVSSINYRQAGGFVTTKTPLSANVSTGVCIIDGGTLVYDKNASTTKQWTKVNIVGGRMVFNGVGASGGVNMVECNVTSGVLDMTQDSRAKTITTLRLFPGSTFLTHENITVTNLIDMRSTQVGIP